jgi:hypothetical protein
MSAVTWHFPAGLHRSQHEHADGVLFQARHVVVGEVYARRVTGEEATRGRGSNSA